MVRQMNLNLLLTIDSVLLLLFWKENKRTIRDCLRLEKSSEEFPPLN